MKYFIKLLLYFLIPILVLGSVMEGLLRHIPNNYASKASYLVSNSNRIETLILGSSHTLYGINPDYLTSKAFNASFVSQTPDIDLAILQQFDNDLSNLKTVVIRLSYASLFEKLAQTREDWRLKDYNLYFNLKADYTLKQHFEILSVKLKTNLNRIYNYYVLNKCEKTSSPLGWGIIANSKPPENLERAGINVAKRHTIVDTSLYRENVEHFEAIAEFCKVRDIKLIVVTLPGYQSYVKHMDANQLKKTIEFGEFLDNKYANCRYYNLLTDKTFNDEDFFDGDHLNSKGAKKLTKKLNELLK